MRARQSVLLDTARHVQDFMDAHAALLGPSIVSARKNLDDAVAQLTAMSVTQAGGTIATQGATAQQRALRKTLRNNQMKPVATIAKLLLPDNPNLSAMTMPVKQLKATQLVAAAHGMADAAEANKAVFTGAGLPDDFATQLRNAADAVTTSLSLRQQSSNSKKGATAGLSAQETRVRNLITLINALVVPKLGTDVVLLTAWKSAKALVHRAPITPVPAATATAASAPQTTGTGAPSSPPSPAPTGGSPPPTGSTTAPAAA